MRGFAIYQIGRAGRPRFAARVVSQVFDRDQFLGVEIDLINKEFPIRRGFQVVPVAGQAQRLLGRPRASCI